MPSSGVAGEAEAAAPSAVMLHVYDVSGSSSVSGVNQVLNILGTGVYHAAVEVYSDEWSYGFIDVGTGVFTNPPRECSMHSYRESLSMGRTALTRGEVSDLLRQLMVQWRGSEYDLLRHNCCHFSQEFCRRLGVDDIPSWVMNLAGAGAVLGDGIQGVTSTGATIVQTGAGVVTTGAGVVASGAGVVATGALAAGAATVQGAATTVKAVDEKLLFGAGSTIVQGGVDGATRLATAVAPGEAGAAQGGYAYAPLDNMGIGLVAKTAAMAAKTVVQAPVDLVTGVVASGKQAREADADSQYRFGDFSRGLATTFTGAVAGIASGASSVLKSGGGAAAAEQAAAKQ
eukprot:TRINITY_DN124598_c0_g1_i1.p1 TRINITY_DN124598_c0_g1~~TRINITY_DN124598_c0_g1_i1.p1  ORF type:complete len:343 (-),score=76.63 TRINITY_DN124598_c0_g1_i1:86-1114(-)